MLFNAVLASVVVVFQSLSPVRLFVTPWAAACQPSLSFTVSLSLLKFMFTEKMMPSNPLIFCHSLCPFAFNLSQHQGLFQWNGSSHQVAKVLELQLQHQLISFRMDWLESKGLSRVFSSSPVQKNQFFSAQPSLWPNFYICTWLLEKP